MKNCRNCGAPPESASGCAYCGTRFSFKRAAEAPRRLLTHTSAHPYRMFATLCLLFIVCFNGFCGASQLAALQSALNAAPTLVNSLVASGTITQAQADTTIKDFRDGAQVAVDMKRAFSAIPKDAPNRKQLQYQAAHKALNDWRAIVARGHFRITPKIESAFVIADGIFEFVDAYYADKAGITSHSDIGADGLSEDEFEKALDQRLKDLKEALKP